MKRTLILTEDQLEEISGLNCSYFDNEGINDMHQNFADETSAEGSSGEGSPAKPTNGADTIAHDISRISYPMGVGMSTRARFAEMKKRDWENKYILGEEEEHGNQRLNGRKFGPNEDGEKKSYDATKMANSRFNAAKETLQTGTTTNDKLKAQQTIQRMENNWNGINIAMTQYDNAKNADKIIQSTKDEKIKSAPKETGNGKAHSVKDGFITPVVNN